MNMAIQVKIYSARSQSELEHRLNCDLLTTDHTGTEVIDIKYVVKAGYKLEPKEYSAMVIFK